MRARSEPELDRDPKDPVNQVPGPHRVLTPAMLRDWPLPSVGDSKYSRGQVLVIGGARRTPGAAVLAGLAALRVGAGRLTMAVAESVAPALAVATPEAGVVGLAENRAGSVTAEDIDVLATDLEAADAVLIGAGLDDADLTAALLRQVLPQLGPEATVVLDAYALGVLPRVEERETVAGRLVLTPNLVEGAFLLDHDGDLDEGDLHEAVPAMAERYQAVVSCHNVLADPSRQVWVNSSGHGGLGTSGSGDVLAGAALGLLARGAPPDQAACWATYLHAAGGDRLAAQVGPLGFLARELLDQLPRVLVELNT
ncbi:NAD(P)H-hydrate dehydratase [Nakamurella leprariae]|uniref:ADP-dependent (S)-NAD(P)H-hydrate dehydratase n=1 Tax=Nakamurella leprariae TaxID=2803911 RepID=A0A939BXB8_9ACTN|nr:NAD(P)H-hydrate dehydratase [Nakamurella leprariae]MBM9468398.1 NAD(P)H-hydrate dehydratase [Nakamurella leprariae]